MRGEKDGKEIMIGYLKGYNIFRVSKREMKKDKVFGELETSIKEEILNTFEKNGFVYGFKKGKVLKVVYLFDSNQNEGEVNLIFTKSYYSKDVEGREEEFDNAFLEAIKDKIVLDEFSKITWKDNEIEVKNEQEDKVVITLPLCMVLGMGLGLIFNNLLLGTVIGIIVGTLLGLITNTKE